jgi:hypothetical protein
MNGITCDKVYWPDSHCLECEHFKVTVTQLKCCVKDEVKERYVQNS